MAGKLSKFQTIGFTGWMGLTSDNHLGAMFQRQPQRATDIMIQLLAYNRGNTLETFLNQFPTKEFDDDTGWYGVMSPAGAGFVSNAIPRYAKLVKE